MGFWKEVVPVVGTGTRHLSKTDMVTNDATPDVRIDAETLEVVVDGKWL